MSAPFMIRPDTNQVCAEAGMRLLSAEPVAASVPGAVNLQWVPEPVLHRLPHAGCGHTPVKAPHPVRFGKLSTGRPS